MRSCLLGLFLSSVFTLSGTAATPLLHSTFSNPGEGNTGTAGWMAVGGSGAVHVSSEAGAMLDGKPSLAFDYEIGPGKLGLAMLPLAATGLAPDGLATLDQIHFWVKTEFPTSVAIVLSEKQGGNYNAMVWSPGNVWQEVRVEPRDFTLADKTTDRPDPDGKLDLDQIQGIGVTDLGQIFGGGKEASAGPIVVTRRLGHHTLWLAGFEALTGNPLRPDRLLIDTFDTPQLSWASPGGATLRLDRSGEHTPGPALEASYTSAENALVFFSRNLPPDIPRGVTHMTFDIACEKSAQLVFALQEKGTGHGEGPRYNTTVEVKGGGKSSHRELALSAFTHDVNGPPDDKGELDLTRGKSLVIADISANTGVGEGPNKIWISNLRLIARE